MTVDVKDMLLDKLAIGPVSARVYQGADYAKGPPVLLYFHGGAFLQSGLTECPVARALASTGAIVVVPDYNAPLGGVFPKPLEVGFELFSYLAKKRAGFGDRKSLLLIGGEESGGNIAAAIAFKARDHFANELDGQVLMSPLVDPFMGSASFRNADAIGMRQRWAEGWSHYLSGGVCHPYAAPCTCSRLSGVAPALLLTSQDDPLLDEITGYADRLRSAGNTVHQHVLPAGTGWPAIYGGKTDAAPGWHGTACAQFSDFVRDISTA
ncbi:alpha/beta hydrolase fold domain-containing protein [Phaeovulum sp. W22_SRMD_FR3]|uniref:alpha/beta hydrolase fold domain-containing protein n=1 Tax=Phaeovulum sp. W22_SRMD_FR3 TaxID=3240274 RepID=UPI003F9D27E0